MRVFASGATRDTDDLKNDYEAFLSPLVLEAYGDYMTAHCVQADGTVRDGDNWQKGIPKGAYMKSLLRHVLVVWKLWRGWPVRAESVGGTLQAVTLKAALCACLFNVMGLLHELLRDELVTDGRMCE